MEVWVGKIVGQSGPGRWSQVHDFAPADEKLESHGRLVAVLSLRDSGDPTEIEMVAAGREILSRLHELYFGTTGPNVLDQLKFAVTAVEQEASAHNMQLTMSAVAICQDRMYVVSVGSGVWVRAGEKEGWLVEPDHAHMSAFNGALQPGQVLVVGNRSFWQEVPLGIVRAGIANDPEAMLENLGAIIHGSASLATGVGVVLRVQAPAVVPTPVLPSPVPPMSPKPSRNWLEQLKSKIPIPRPNIYLSSDRTNNGRRAMYGGIAFLAILLLLVLGWRIREKQIEQKTSLSNQAIEEVLYKFREAKALADLNPARSRELLTEVESQLAGITDSKDPRVQEVQTGLPEVLGAATGTKTPAAQEVLNLDLVRSEMRGKVMRLLEDELIVLDSEGNRLVIVDPERKRGEVVAGEDNLGKTLSLATYPGKIIVLSDKGVIECLGSGEECAVKVPSQDWGSVSDVGMFGGNIYVLGGGAIWRHQVTETGYTNSQDWMAEEDSNLNNGRQMTIDGSIWIASSGGEIWKYTRGVKDNFTLLDLGKPLGQSIQLFGSEEGEKLYILDSENGRVVVVLKTGEYDSQYILSDGKEASSFVVDESGGQIYLLAGSKIWSVKL